MTGTAPTELSRDGFLGGRLSVLQPRRGYRAGIDPVLLAAAVTAGPGDAVLELGCGAGVACLCLAARVGGLEIAAVERRPELAELARRNAAANGVALSVECGDLAAMPAALRARSFDHVLANPPYHRRGAGPVAAEPGREAGRAEATPLAAWLESGIRRLRPGGVLTVIQRADRVPDLLAGLDARMGRAVLLPLAPRAGRPARLVLLRAVKGGGAAFRLMPPLTLHEGAAHDGDRESYAPEIRAVLRDAAPVPWPPL